MALTKIMSTWEDPKDKYCDHTAEQRQRWAAQRLHRQTSVDQWGYTWSQRHGQETITPGEINNDIKGHHDMSIWDANPGLFVKKAKFVGRTDTGEFIYDVIMKDGRATRIFYHIDKTCKYQSWIYRMAQPADNNTKLTPVVISFIENPYTYVPKLDGIRHVHAVAVHIVENGEINQHKVMMPMQEFPTKDIAMGHVLDFNKRSELDTGPGIKLAAMYHSRIDNATGEIYFGTEEEQLESSDS